MAYLVRAATLDDIDTLVHHRIAMFTDMGTAIDEARVAPAFAAWLRELMPSGTYRAWVVECLAGTSQASSPFAPSAGSASSRAASSDDELRASESRGDIVAGGGATIIPWPPGPSYLGDRLAFVYNVYTEPAHRRRGLGRLVMAALHAWCREHHVTSVALNASADGRPLYEAMGYAVTPSPMMFLSLLGV